jgi:hypothetical protein
MRVKRDPSSDRRPTRLLTVAMGNSKGRPTAPFQHPIFVRRRLWWIALALVFVDAGSLLRMMKGLQKQGNGILLKSTSEVGNTWTQIVFDEGRETADALNLVHGVGLALFVGLSWWLITKEFNRPWSKIAYSLYAIAGTLSFLFGYAYLQGMADTVHDFPVVAISGMTPSDRDICFLLGQDDKMFALLDIKLNEKKLVASRYVIYLPRTEVK